MKHGINNQVYLATFDTLMGDQRTKTTFAEVIRGIISSDSLCASQIACFPPPQLARSQSADKRVRPDFQSENREIARIVLWQNRVKPLWMLAFEAVGTLVACAWVAAGFLFHLGLTLDHWQVRLLAHLGGWEPRANRS